MDKQGNRVRLEAALRELFAPFQKLIDKIIVENGLDKILEKGRAAYAALNLEFNSGETVDNIKAKAAANRDIQDCDLVINALIYQINSPDSKEPWAIEIKRIRKEMFEKLRDASPELHKQGLFTGVTDEEEAQAIINKGDDSGRLNIKGRIAVLNLPEIAGSGFTIWAFPIKGSKTGKDPGEKLMLHSHKVECVTIVTGNTPVEEEVYDATPSNPMVTFVSGNLRYPGNAVLNHPDEANGHIIRNPSGDEQALTLHMCGFSPGYGIIFNHNESIGLIGPVVAAYEGPQVVGTIPREREYFLSLGEMNNEPEPPAEKLGNRKTRGPGEVIGEKRSVSHQARVKTNPVPGSSGRVC